MKKDLLNLNDANLNMALRNHLDCSFKKGCCLHDFQLLQLTSQVRSFHTWEHLLHFQDFIPGSLESLFCLQGYHVQTVSSQLSKTFVSILLAVLLLTFCAPNCLWFLFQILFLSFLNLWRPFHSTHLFLFPIFISLHFSYFQFEISLFLLLRKIHSKC